MISILSSIFPIQLIQAPTIEDIYIRSDGSIEPSTSPIQRDENLYTFTGNIYAKSIVIEKNNIIIDGNTYVYSGDSGRQDNGFYIENRDNVTIRNLNINSYFDYPIEIRYSTSISIIENNITNNNSGIRLLDSSDCVINNNNLTNNENGVSCYLGSSSNIISENNFVGCGLMIGTFGHNTVIDNHVNGKPLVYLEETSDVTIPENAGQVILINCTRVIVENLNISNTDTALELLGTNETIISTNDISNTAFGVFLTSSFNNTILRNNITEHSGYAFILGSSNNNTLMENNITTSIGYADIYLAFSMYNVISKNKMTTISAFGIHLAESSNLNIITENNISGQSNGIYLVSDSSRNAISGNNITNHANGIQIGRTGSNARYNNITDNNILNNGIGIRIGSLSNRFVHNNLVSNIQQVGFADLANEYNNIWDDGYPLGGNFWSDYTSEDLDNDGIGDSPYIIDNSNIDNYPLMEPYNWNPPNPNGLTADFTYSPSTPLLDEVIEFDASPSNLEDAYYHWNFDGEIVEETEVTQSHSFSSAGNYEVTLTVTDKDGLEDSATRTITVWETWTFATITDLHIGRGYPDYGGIGIDSEDRNVEGQDYYLTERLEKTVDWIIDNQDNYNIRFVAVLGDISDSGEYSELEKAKDILDRLNEANIPYVPVMGNHDIWPETNDDRDIRERYFEEVFESQYDKLAENSLFSLEKQPLSDDLQNYVFHYDGIEFVILDFVSRLNPNQILPGISGTTYYAALNKKTKTWLEDCLVEGNSTILFSHHPMIADRTSFKTKDISKLTKIFRNAENLYNTTILSNFAGHIHGLYNEHHPYPLFTPGINPVFMNANQIHITDLDVPVITTEALMVASNAVEPKGIIRLIEINSESLGMQERIINYNALEGKFHALNPYFTPTSGQILTPLSPDTLYLEFEAYAFNEQEFSEGQPLSYTMYFGDGSSQTILDSSGKPVTFSKYYEDWSLSNQYDVTLVISGYSQDITEQTEERISKTISFEKSHGRLIFP